MSTIPTVEPSEFRAGDTVKWQRTLSDYPASAGWSLSYRLINAAGKIDIDASASVDDHLVSVASTASAAYAVGAYDWVAYVEKAGERYTVGSGRITIRPDLAAQSAGYDARSTARKLLDAVEAVLANRATRADLEYEIAGRRMKSMSHADLLAARDKLKREVAAEEAASRIAAGMGSGRRVFVRF